MAVCTILPKGDKIVARQKDGGHVAVPYEVGSRVFAVRDSDDETVNLFGFGVYVGDRIPDTWAEPDTKMIDMIRESLAIDDANPGEFVRSMLDAQVEQGQITHAEYNAELETALERQKLESARPIEERAHEIYQRVAANPCIELDDGSIVWGYECWWGPEERFESWRAGRTVQNVKVTTI